MTEKGLKILKLVGFLIALLAFVLLIVACAMPEWTKCEKLDYSNGLWMYKDVSTDGDMRKLYEENIQRVVLEDSRCTSKTKNRWYTTNTQCQSAYYCDATGQVTDTRTCNSTSQFDASAATCKNSGVTKTQISGCQHPDCKGKSDGYYFVDKSVCKVGYRCTSSGLSRSSDVTCTGTQLYVSGSCQNLGSDGATCKNYHACDGSSDTTVTRTCAAGNYFDGSSCVAATVSGTDSSAPSGCYHEDCSSDGAKRSGTPTPTFTYDVQCKKSYFCKNSRRTKQTLTDCTGSLQFDLSSPPTCQAAPQSGCVDTACNGKGDGWHITDSGVCRTYIQCRQGVKTSTGSCSNANELALISSDRSTVTCTNHNRDGSTCNAYLTCSSTTVTQSTCPSGQYYDPAAKSCTAPTVSGTTTTVPSGCRHVDCQGKANGFYYGRTSVSPFYDINCDTAYQCNNNIHTSYPKCSTSGHQYNLAVNPPTCSSTLQDKCKHTDCNSKSNGFHVTDGTTCKNYIHCIYNGAKNFTAGGTCASGRVFVISSGGSTGSCSTTTASGSTTCKDPRCDSKPNHKEHKDTRSNRICQNWYKCSNNFYTEGSCAQYENYNLGNEQCSASYPYTGTDSSSAAFTCIDSRCNGKSDGLHTLDPECRTYIRCTGGYQTASYTCPSGQLFESSASTCKVFDITGGSTHLSCRINGGLNAWSAWSACVNNKGNHFGIRTRSRSCNYPTKRNGGNDCSAATAETTICWLCPTQAEMEAARYLMIFSLALGGLALCFILNSFCAKSTYPTAITALCSLGVFAFGLGSAIAYSNVHPEEIDDCFEKGYAWNMAIAGAVFGFISFILWIVATLKTKKRNGSLVSSKVDVH